MSPDQQPGNDLDALLRRAADHLVRRGAEYAEHPVDPTVVARARGGRWQPTRAALVGLASTCAVVLAVGAVALTSGGSTGRVAPMSTDGSDDAAGTSVDSGIVGDDTAVPPSATDAGGDGGDSGDGSGEGDGSGDGSATTLEWPPITILPPPDTRPDPTTDVTVTVPDFEGPVLGAVEHPAVVTAGTSFSVRWRAADPDGVSSTGVTFGWASGIWTTCGFGQSARLVSGTVTDGVWGYTCAVPLDAVNTEYSIDISAQDNFGNWTGINGFRFTIVGGSSDALPPAYRNVDIVNSPVVGGSLTVTWTLDDPSGIDSAVMWVAGPTGGFADPSGTRYALYETMVVTRECSADGTSCNFTQTVQLSPTAPAGSYALWVSATDSLGNKVLEQVLTFTVLG